jgi:glycosyltransferase involved in cell wall biosynthesis
MFHKIYRACIAASEGDPDGENPGRARCRRLMQRFLNALLWRYTPFLKRIYHSRWGRALWKPRGLAAPVVERVKKKAVKSNRALRLPALLKLGFTEKALDELEQMAAGSESMAGRLAAAWELAVWYSNNPGRKGAEKALPHLDFLLAGERSGGRLQRAAVLRSECLGRLGRNGEAVSFAATCLERYGTGNELALTLSNLYAAEDTEPGGKHVSDRKRLALINGVLAGHGLEKISLENPDRLLDINNIYCPDCRAGMVSDGPLATVLVPAFNAEACMSTALKSLLSQTWRNLEIIVVDDAGTDGTSEVVRSFSEKDGRVRYLRNQENRGPYVARNLGLTEARGEFVTCHDTDDWSHPRKIEIQLRRLLENADAIGNLSMCVRVQPNMIFHRRGNAGFYASKNMSSLMFRRDPVLRDAGFWDSVRFAGDSEYIRRLKRIYGDDAVAVINALPLSFVAQGASSLTGSGSFGYNGILMGARAAYKASYTIWHQRSGPHRMEFPARERPFPVPAPMEPFRRAQNRTPRHLDVVIATDFRLTGGTISSTIEEIKAQRAMGLRTGLFPLSRFDLNPAREWNEKILQQVDGDRVHLLVYGEEVSCDLLMVRHPPVLQEYQDYLPKIQAENILVIVNQSPFRDVEDPTSRIYDLNPCSRNLVRCFGRPGTWLPIGPAVRNALLQEPDVSHVIDLGDEDWVNIIDVEEWRVPGKKGTEKRPVIGRHSRDQYVKWPSSAEELLAVYPADDGFGVKVLGGADAACKILGKIPENWTVYPFDAMSPVAFLSEIDVYVFFTRSGCVEAFGRSPLEAMAAGVPVVLPLSFRPLFKEAALYAEPFEVRSTVMQLYTDRESYRRQAEIGQRFVRRHFGFDEHRRRLARYVKNPCLEDASSEGDGAVERF